MPLFKISSVDSDNEARVEADIIYVDIGDKLQLVIDPDNNEIRVYPRSAGELWDAPYEVLQIDTAGIERLESDLDAAAEHAAQLLNAKKKPETPTIEDIRKTMAFANELHRVTQMHWQQRQEYCEGYPDLYAAVEAKVKADI